jgi:hypothetical protein
MSGSSARVQSFRSTLAMYSMEKTIDAFGGILSGVLRIEHLVVRGLFIQQH